MAFRGGGAVDGGATDQVGVNVAFGGEVGVGPGVAGGVFFFRGSVAVVAVLEMDVKKRAQVREQGNLRS